MNTKRILLAACVTIMFAVASQAQVAVIAHESVADNVDAGALTEIYNLSKASWGNNSRIVVVDNTGNSSAREQFYGFIGQNPAALSREWLRKQLTGEGRAPQTASSDSEVISRVASTPGAIGYVSEGSVSGSVKVLLVIK